MGLRSERTAGVRFGQRVSVLDSGCPFWTAGVRSGQRVSILDSGCPFWPGVRFGQRVSVLDTGCPQIIGPVAVITC